MIRKRGSGAGVCLWPQLEGRETKNYAFYKRKERVRECVCVCVKRGKKESMIFDHKSLAKVSQTMSFLKETERKERKEGLSKGQRRGCLANMSKLTFSFIFEYLGYLMTGHLCSFLLLLLL